MVFLQNSQEFSLFIYVIEDEAALTPAHTKKWFKLYKAYFILSLTLATYSLVMTPCLCKVSSTFIKKKHAENLPFRSLGTNITTNTSDEKCKQISINNYEEEVGKCDKKYEDFHRKCEFQKPLLLKDCLISFEPHKGLDSSDKNLINSLKSDLDSVLNSEKHENMMYSSYPPAHKIKEVKVYKNSDNRSIDKDSGLQKMFKRIKKG